VLERQKYPDELERLFTKVATHTGVLSAAFLGQLTENAIAARAGGASSLTVRSLFALQLIQKPNVWATNSAVLWSGDL